VLHLTAHSVLRGMGTEYAGDEAPGITRICYFSAIDVL
jgi:hypothetical protein